MGALERWPDLEVEEVQKMLMDGYSAALIGSKLGRSRCSVLGIIHRRRLVRPQAPAITASPPKRQPTPPGGPKLVHPDPSQAAPSRSLTIAQLIADLPPPQPYDFVRYKQTCTFLVDDTGPESLYCCAPTNGEHYCTFHKRIMYRVAT
jgi:hypothetical protein